MIKLVMSELASKLLCLSSDVGIELVVTQMKLTNYIVNDARLVFSKFG